MRLINNYIIKKTSGRAEWLGLEIKKNFVKNIKADAASSCRKNTLVSGAESAVTIGPTTQVASLICLIKSVSNLVFILQM